MGKKYIIELLDDCPSEFKGIIVFGLTPTGQISAEPIPVEDLTPYTEPDLEQIRKEAYDKGYEDAEEKYNDGYSDGYDAGLDDAWKAARKIHRMPEGDILDLFPDCYASVCTAAQAILKYDASEAIAKIKEYEDGKQEIKVGDEVGYFGFADEDGNVNYSGVVLEIRKDDYLVMEKDGKTYQLKKKLVMSKTGRHFPEIAAVLEKMRGEQE